MDQPSSNGENTQEVSAQDVLQQSEGIFGTDTAEENVEAQPAEQEGTEPQKEQEEKPEDKLFASKFAALSRKEKAIKDREAQVEARMAELEAKMAEMQQPKVQEEEEEPFELQIKRNPLEAIKKKFGLDYETMTNIALNDGKLPVEMQLELVKEQLDRKYSSQLNELKEQLESEKKEKETERHQQVVEGFKGQIRTEIESGGEAYELIKAEGDSGIELVYDVIEENYNNNGSIMNVKEASGLVEDYLLEEAKKRIGLSKIKKLVGASENPAQKKPSEPNREQSVTLSNSQSQTSQAGDRFLSDDESKMKAAQLIKWIED